MSSSPNPVPSAAPKRKASSGAPQRKVGVREQAAQETRATILRAATKIFAKHGFSGGRIEQISKAAKSYDRMIYYYFGSKEGLFVAVLEEMYRRFNEAEAQLVLRGDDPVESLKAVISFTWDFYYRHPEFITLLNDENLHGGRHISRSMRAAEFSSPAVKLLESVLASGVEKGMFRQGISGRNAYIMIAALNYFYLSNRHTLSAFFGEKLNNPEALRQWQGFVVDSVVRALRA